MRRRANPNDPLWYKDAVIYELPVTSFYDANGDGVGDFQGLCEKLDYLEQLGVTCLWLLPFFPSPLKDDGYDIADFTSVDPRHGTLEEFRTFVHAAHDRGMRVVIELVLNHTSDQHPWFQRARAALPGSPERAYYVWSDTDQKNKDVRVLLPETEHSNWTWDPVAEAYYWRRFFRYEPDLNYDNAAVVQEMLAVLQFWLDQGVDGFRLDALPYLVERDGTTCENLPETHAIVGAIRRHVDAKAPGRMLLADANQLPSDVCAYFGDGDECHMAYHFPVMSRMFMALHLEDRHPIVEVMERTPSIPDACQWALFLRNHDERSLDSVSGEEREYLSLAYGVDPQVPARLAIRRRLAPLVRNDRRRIELLNALLFSLPGTPVIYYGDEVGMGDNVYLGDRRGVRTPMQWTGDRNGGFSRADPPRLFSPVIMDALYGYQAVSVEAQESDPASLLHWTRNLIRLRGLFKVFGRGTTAFLQPANRKVLAYVRQFGGDVVLCVANLSHTAQPASLDLTAFAGLTPVEMLGYTEFPPIAAAPYFLTLAPYGFYWFELQR